MERTAPPSINHFWRVETSWTYNKSFLRDDDEEGVAAFTLDGPLGRFPSFEMLRMI